MPGRSIYTALKRIKRLQTYKLIQKNVKQLNQLYTDLDIMTSVYV